MHDWNDYWYEEAPISYATEWLPRAVVFCRHTARTIWSGIKARIYRTRTPKMAGFGADEELAAI